MTVLAESKPRDMSQTLAKKAAADGPLDDRQSKAVELLSAGLAPKGVADTIGITTQQLATWRKKPSFKLALSEAMQIDADVHGARLQLLYGKALDRVSDLLDDPSPHIRVQAARLAFEAQQNIARVIEEQKMMEALEARMDALAEAGAIGGGAFEPIQDAEIIEEEPIDDEH